MTSAGQLKTSSNGAGPPQSRKNAREKGTHVKNNARKTLRKSASVHTFMRDPSSTLFEKAVTPYPAFGSGSGSNSSTSVQISLKVSDPGARRIGLESRAKSAQDKKLRRSTHTKSEKVLKNRGSVRVGRTSEIFYSGAHPVWPPPNLPHEYLSKSLREA